MKVSMWISNRHPFCERDQISYKAIRLAVIAKIGKSTPVKYDFGLSSSHPFCEKTVKDRNMSQICWAFINLLFRFQTKKFIWPL